MTSLKHGLILAHVLHYHGGVSFNPRSLRLLAVHIEPAIDWTRRVFLSSRSSPSSRTWTMPTLTTARTGPSTIRWRPSRRQRRARTTTTTTALPSLGAALHRTCCKCAARARSTGFVTTRFWYSRALMAAWTIVVNACVACLLYRRTLLTITSWSRKSWSSVPNNV